MYDMRLKTRQTVSLCMNDKTVNNLTFNSLVLIFEDASETEYMIYDFNTDIVKHSGYLNLTSILYSLVLTELLLAAVG